jgi:hypothetical protein
LNIATTAIQPAFFEPIILNTHHQNMVYAVSTYNNVRLSVAEAFIFSLIPSQALYMSTSSSIFSRAAHNLDSSD